MITIKFALDNVVIPFPDRSSTVNLDIQVDFQNKIVHLLDKDLFESVSLTNAISHDLMQEVQDRLPFSISYFRVFTYHTDGITCEYKFGRLSYNEYDEIIMPQFFLETMKKRRKKLLTEYVG